jgi:predicted nucleotidyltransferase
MDNNFGIEDADLETIIEVISDVAEVNEIIIFGSRAKGTFRRGSDVDLALKGQQLTTHTISHISNILNEETTMPYHFDVINYHTINNVHLCEHIDRVGRSIYKKKSAEVA